VAGNFTPSPQLLLKNFYKKANLEDHNCLYLNETQQSNFVKMPLRTLGASPATDIINGVIPNFNYSNNRTNLPYLT